MGYSTSNLLEDIKSRGTIPTSQNNWTTTKLLRLATDVMRLHIVPLMSSAREEYFVAYSDTPMTSSLTSLDINRRAVGMGLRDVELVSEDGSSYSIPRLNEEQKELASGLMFYLRWNKIILTATRSSGSLRQSFMIRPGELCATTEAGVVDTINTATNTVTLTGDAPSTFLNNSYVDFVASEGGHEYLGVDYQITGATGADVTFSSLPDGLSAGDWLCPRYKSPVPQIPDDLMPALAQRCVAQINEAGGYWDQRTAAMETYQEMVDGMFKLISPRVQGEAKKIVAFGGRGMF